MSCPKSLDVLVSDVNDLRAGPALAWLARARVAEAVLPWVGQKVRKTWPSGAPLDVLARLGTALVLKAMERRKLPFSDHKEVERFGSRALRRHWARMAWTASASPSPPKGGAPGPSL